MSRLPVRRACHKVEDVYVGLLQVTMHLVPVVYITNTLSLAVDPEGHIPPVMSAR